MRGLLVILVAVVTLQVPLAAQPPAPDSLVVDTAGISPGTAMYRSWLVPGWGQISVGVYGRAAFFVSAQATSAYMLFRTAKRLSTARGFERAAVVQAADSLNDLIRSDPSSEEAIQLMDPVAFRDAIGQHPSVVGTRGLVESRSQQRQDWITYTIFFTLLSGVDAFVAAHLQDSPVGTSIGVPEPDGAFTFRFTIPVGGG